MFSDINECEVTGSCGENTSCTDLVGNPTHTCSCLPGTEQRSSGDAYTIGCAGKIWQEIADSVQQLGGESTIHSIDLDTKESVSLYKMADFFLFKSDSQKY